jgi:HlyD family secretion protein
MPHLIFSFISFLKSKLTLTLAFGMALLMIGCNFKPKETAQAQPQTQGGERNRITPVDVVLAEVGLLKKQPEYIGTTTALRTVSLRSQVEGQLLALKVDVGDGVKAGEVVGQVDDSILLTTVNQAEAELAVRKSEVVRAQTQVSNARTQVERSRLEAQQAISESQRQEKLWREGAIAQQDAEQSITKAQTSVQAFRAAQQQVNTEQKAVEAAQGRVIAQEALLAQTQRRRFYSQLVAPITGVVAEKLTEPGNLLQANGELLKIADLSKIKVIVQVSELELGKIRPGQGVRVKLDAFANVIFPGQVIRISPVADASSRLVPVEVVIANNGRVGSGLLARVNFQTETQPRIIVPQSAIEIGEKSETVTGKEDMEGRNIGGNIAGKKEKTLPRAGNIFIATTEDGKTKAKVTMRPVTLGDRADGKVEILSGLNPGEAYVTKSGKPLKNGETVRLSILSERGK